MSSSSALQRCPDAEQLRRLLADQLPGPEAVAVEAHVEVCPDCQRGLERLTAGAGDLCRLREDEPTAAGLAPTAVPARGGPALAPGAGTRQAGEVQLLLRRRLLFIAVALLVTFVVYAVGFAGLLATDPVMQ